ncbi:hypothetical protein DV711_14160 [Motiliproteus coralliicola]|uniref:DUF2059 domain-containing protein n=1 Tax=Motiliproteus coralliicola TaxID=2283196 RepID=A0A369WBS9_9GAMM|nr:hypothetical protein [Motiliproteus coralliicola]RDE18761.1 hypothetical protein DV711_14160 [Motiliproteus coralliicola]
MNLIRSIALTLLCSAPLTAQAQIYTDDLSRCLVESSTHQDKLTLVRWMFSAMALHPSVQSMASINADQRDQANQEVAGLFMQLTTERCLPQLQNAVKYEGPMAMQASFRILGQVAAQELFANPEVKQGMAGLQQHMDNERLQQVLKPLLSQ